MRLICLFVLLFAFIFCFPILLFVDAQVRINEIGIEQSPQTIELINTASESADISHWYLDDSGGTTYYTIPQNTYFYHFSCLIFTYDLNLNKSSPDTIRFFDATAPPTSSSAHIIDSYSYKSSPGNNLTYARFPDTSDNWITSEATFGLWNSTRENCVIMPTSTPTPTLTPTPIITASPTITLTPTPTTSITSYPNTYDSIYISEVMVYPETNNNEWIELYNDNDFAVSLHNWYIDDLENEGSSPKLFSLEIPVKEYRIFELSSSLFNNNGDSVRLLDADKNEKDSFEYDKAVQGETFGRISFESDYFCLQNQSKNAPNNSCMESTPEPTKKTNTTSAVKANRSAVQLDKSNSTSPQINTYNPSAITAYNISTKQKGTQNVLGENTQIDVDQLSYVPFYKTLYYISFTYSLLTIFSVLIKIKNAF